MLNCTRNSLNGAPLPPGTACLFEPRATAPRGRRRPALRQPPPAASAPFVCCGRAQGGALRLRPDPIRSDPIRSDPIWSGQILICATATCAVVASAKGVVVGRLRYSEDGDEIDCSKARHAPAAAAAAAPAATAVWPA